MSHQITLSPGGTVATNYTQNVAVDGNANRFWQMNSGAVAVTGGNGTNGSWGRVDGGQRTYAASTVGGTTTITIEEATDVAGTGAREIARAVLVSGVNAPAIIEAPGTIFPGQDGGFRFQRARVVAGAGTATVRYGGQVLLAA